ncbi:MAG TPA: hypothetical protein VL282_17570 [Tepidisphaeraceae bacterium]|jgi:hypothetical protein|nr:hypothetical protein [Tepidisphaeraceae bacterium]
MIDLPLSSDPESTGRTVFRKDAGGPHRAARIVNVDAFFDEFFSVCE